MDQELENLIKERYETLPPDLKKTLATLPIRKLVQDIATEAGLHVDQAGDLYTETVLVLLGAEKMKDYERNVQDNLHISSPLAQMILRLTNEKIFTLVRESLKAMQDLQESSPESDEEILDKDSILKDIENPEPVTHPISAADQTRPGPAPLREITPETPTLVADKLTETTSIPSEKVTISAQGESPKTKSYTVDPYREALN